MIAKNNLTAPANSEEIPENASLGERLRRIREERDLDLAEAAAKTNIQEKYLYFLEAGDYDSLPADVYTRGFLRHYAKFLGLTESEALELYKKEKGKYDHLKLQQAPPQPLARERLIITPKMIRNTFIILAAVAILSYIAYQIIAFNSAPDLAVTAPEDNISLSENTITVSGSTEKGAQVSINGQTVLVDEGGVFNEKVTLQSGINSLSIVATDKRGNQAIVERQVKVELPQNEVVVEANEAFPVVLSVLVKDEATWIKVMEDETLAYTGTLLPGSEKVFRAVNQIIISSGKPDKTFIKVNEQAQTALGAPGEVVQDKIFTANGL